MNFQDMQNAVLQRLHQGGANWGSAADNNPQNLVPPYWVKLELNAAYGRFLALVKDFPVCVRPLRINFPTTPNQNKVPINPCPSMATGVSLPNPAALQIYEFSYTQSGGQERYIPFVSTATFRRFTAGYTQRLGSYSAFPDVLCQAFGRSFIEMFPGFATKGDTVNLTICPDPQGTEQAFPGKLSAANGGIMILDTDRPLIPDEFMQAIVEGAVAVMARSLDKPEIAQEAKAHWDQLVQEAIDYGSTAAEGDAEQQVIDTWFTTFDSQINIIGGGG